MATRMSKKKTAGKSATRGSRSRNFKPATKQRADAADRLEQILARLKKTYPDARCALHHDNALQLLIATILSAQCTDERVNQVTPGLFKRYPTAAAFAAADPAELEETIRSTGFYRNKAKSIMAACRELVQNHDGKVPADRDALVSLAGVGRKTANVVLGNAFGAPAVVTDTHVIRLARLMGLSAHKDPVKLEFDLMELAPRKDWTLMGHLLIFHGRQVCKAGRPQCDDCVVRAYCSFGMAEAART